MALRHHATDYQIGILFACVFFVAAVFGLGAARVLHAWRHRKTTPPPRFWPVGDPRLDRLLLRALDAACLLGLACLAYGFLVEPTAVEVVRVPIASERVRPESGVIRIVHLSDLHSEGEALNEPAVARIVEGLKPDLVAVTGDFINDPAGTPVARALLAGIKAPYGVYLVRGNVDIGELPEDAFDGLGVETLERAAREVDVRGTRLRLLGMRVGDEPRFSRWMSSLPPKRGLDVFLFHYTDLVYEAEKAGVDLYLAGHTHGGQVRLPFYGALVTLAKLGKRFEAGLYRVGRLSLYVSRGIGMEGAAAPRVRFLCRPEVALLELSAGPPGPAASR